MIGRVVAIVVVLLAASCGIFRELGLGGERAQWQEKRYRDVNAASLLEFAQASFAKQYPRGPVDVVHGRLESGWSYGRIAEGSRDALRQRVVIETKSEGEVLLVRLRVQQESSETANHVGDPRADDWKPYDDDMAQAKLLLTRLSLQLADLATPVPDAKPESGEATQK